MRPNFEVDTGSRGTFRPWLCGSGNRSFTVRLDITASVSGRNLIAAIVGETVHRHRRWSPIPGDDVLLVSRVLPRMDTSAPPLRIATAAVTMTGVFIRYGFYAAGAFVLVVMAIIPFLRSDPIQQHDTAPAFRLTSPDLAKMPVKASVITGRGARVEIRQYGQLHDRDKDFTVMMVLPPKGHLGARDFMSEVRDLAPLRSGSFTNTFYDLQTRFGPVRAAEFRIYADGRQKLCLAYLSRFETSTVFLKGWYCEDSGIKAGTFDLACNLDSLVIDQNFASTEAGAFLRDRMKRPKLCTADAVTQTTDTRPPRPPVRRF
jgi:hypothetical protein